MSLNTIAAGGLQVVGMVIVGFAPAAPSTLMSSALHSALFDAPVDEAAVEEEAVDDGAEVLLLVAGGVPVGPVTGGFVESCSELVQALRATDAASATVTVMTLPAMRMGVTLGNRVTHWSHRVPE